MKKRALGQFYTVCNPFQHPAFLAWAGRAGLEHETVLEPFAGGNDLIDHLQALGFARKYRSFDCAPGRDDVMRRDTVLDFPREFTVAITNPPWLAKNSATRRNLPFPESDYDDLYKHCLALCLAHCPFVAALIPESFIRSGLFRPRLSGFVSLRSTLFMDTDHPVGLALFEPEAGRTCLWSDGHKIGWLDEIEALRPQTGLVSRDDIRFNAKDGNLGLIAFDNTREASIRFCDIDEIRDYPVKQSSRFITKILIKGQPHIKAYNDFLARFREKTMDVLLTSYRGLRRDGLYRRRMDYALARSIIAAHVG